MTAVLETVHAMLSLGDAAVLLILGISKALPQCGSGPAQGLPLPVHHMSQLFMILSGIAKGDPSVDDRKE